MPLPTPCLMAVTDRALCAVPAGRQGGADGLVAAVEAAVIGGANAVQLREKDLPPAELLALARRLRDVTRGRALLVVNGPPEVAAAAGADGVHLPEGAPMHLKPRAAPKPGAPATSSPGRCTRRAPTWASSPPASR